MVAPEDIADFTGTWSLSRRIADSRAGHEIRAEGVAALQPDGAGGLVYDESVSLLLPGQAPIAGTRRYLWQAVPGGISVRFDDGRRFHRIVLGHPVAEDRHDCAPDHYAGRYDFAGWPVWTAQWIVRGPRKGYRMITTYSRRG